MAVSDEHLEQIRVVDYLWKAYDVSVQVPVGTVTLTDSELCRDLPPTGGIDSHTVGVGGGLSIAHYLELYSTYRQEAKDELNLGSQGMLSREAGKERGPDCDHYLTLRTSQGCQPRGVACLDASDVQKPARSYGHFLFEPPSIICPVAGSP